MAAPLAADIPGQGEINLAPAKPFEVLQEKNGHKSHRADLDITKQIRNIYKDRMKQNEMSWREMILAGQLVGLFIEGKQLLDLNPYTNQYTIRKSSRNDPMKVRAMNLMQYYASNWQSKWGSSNPDYILEALSNSDQDITRARKANIVVDHLQEEFFDWWYVHHEGLLAQCFGWVGARVRLCTQEALTVRRPIIEDREVQIGQGYGKCYDCEWSGSEVQTLEAGEASFPMCPQCGSTGIIFEPPPTQIMQFQTGEEDARIPKVISEQIPLPSVRFDIRYRMENSPWRIFEYDVTGGQLKMMFGKDLRIPEGDTPNTLGLDVTNNLAQVGSPLAGRSETGDGDNKRKNYHGGGVISEMSLSADEMADLYVKGEGKTLSGITLPDGACYADIFPNGATWKGVNGFALLWDVEPIHHSKTDASTVYHMKVMSGTGRGVTDAVESQKQFNRFTSQITRSLQTAATPGSVHLEGAIKPNHLHLVGQPDVNIPINVANFPEIKSIKDVIMPLPAGEIRGDIYNYTQQHLQSFMQLQYHITNFSGGLGQRVNNKTATGAEILDENADAVFSPVLGGKADMVRKLLQKGFNKWVEVNKNVKSFIGFKTVTKAGTHGIEISAEDVEGEYRWRTVPGSDAPKNKLTRRRDRMTFYSLFGGFLPYIERKKDPNFRAEVAELEREFDMDFAANDYDEITEICRARFEAGKVLLGQTQQLQQQAAQQYGVQLPPADPLMILPEVEPSMLVTEADHEVKAEWFARLLDTTEGQRMSSEERNLVSAFVTGHVMLAQGQALEIMTGQAEVQAASQAPLQQAELQNSAAQGEIDTANQPPPPDEAGNAMRQTVMDERAHERQMELEETKHSNAMEAEKTRARTQRAKAKQGQ